MFPRLVELTLQPERFAEVRADEEIERLARRARRKNAPRLGRLGELPRRGVERGVPVDRGREPGIDPEHGGELFARALEVSVAREQQCVRGAQLLGDRGRFLLDDRKLFGE